MSEVRSIRNSHGWLAAVFTLTVLANVISAVAGGPEWIAYVAVAPLVLLMFTGWYLLWVSSSVRRRLTRRQPA
jgi:hypothetical protein